LKDFWLSLQIGFTYIGTVIGAGFASGQEVLQFFTLYGFFGFYGIFLTTFLFIFLGTYMVNVGFKIKASSYGDFNFYLFGKTFGKYVNVFVGFSLFLLTSTMLSGAGSLFQEQFKINFHLGIFLTILLSLFIVLNDIKGVMAINSVVVPFMLFLILLLGSYTLLENNSSNVLYMLNFKKHWVLAALSYASFNLLMSEAVLVPLGGKIKNKGVLGLGILIGGAGLGLLLFITNLMLFWNLKNVYFLHIPMAYIVEIFFSKIKFFFLLILWLEIFTSIVGNAYGLVLSLQKFSNKYVLAIAIFLAAYLFSLCGFLNLVKYLYPLIGYIGFIFILLCCFNLLSRRMNLW